MNMAHPSTFPYSLSFLLFLTLIPMAFSSVPFSSAASTQLEFWSKNVVNPMPKIVASKLSPLSNKDSDSLFASLTSKQSFSNAKFCSMTNLACSSTYKIIPGINAFKIYNFISSHDGSDQKADPNSFFRIAILQKGNKVILPNLNAQIPPRSFLPSEIASKISTTNSKDLEKMFPQSFTPSATKQAIELSTLYCSAPSLKGEIKSCLNSIEDLIRFSKKSLGEQKLVALTTKSTKGSTKEVEIGNIKQFHAEKVVTCHEIFFPFASYYCHLLSSTRLYAVDVVEPLTKAPVNRILAACHMDTSEWPAEHVAFKILKSTPGRGEACHWFKQIDLVWIGSGEKMF